MTNIAVILAGGVGQRAGEGMPKQFRTLADGRTVLQTCVEAFRACPSIDRIIVVMHPDWIAHAQSLLPADITLIAGGKERWESSWNAIRHSLEDGEKVAYSLEDAGKTCYSHGVAVSDEVNILLHDCARPFVSQRILKDVCEALEQHEAVTVAVPATDTMYSVDGSQCTMHDVRLVDIPDRSTMMRAQTPQAFRLNTIKQAYERALQDPNLQATDDCGIVHKYLPDTPIYIIKGEESNRKLTFQEDFFSGEWRIENREL